MSKRRNHFTSSSFYGNQAKLKKFSLTEAVQLIQNEEWDASPTDQADQPVVASQPAKQSLQPSVRHQNCASMIGLRAEQSPTEDWTILHADKDAESELDAQFEYSDVSDDDDYVPPTVTDDDSDDSVEDVHNFNFLDDCSKDSTSMTGAQTSPEHPEGASVTSSPDPAFETSECTKSPTSTSPEENTSKGVRIQKEGKRYFCIFCQKYLAQHLNRHLIKSHSQEAEVAAAQALPEPQRAKALMIIRNKGRDQHNGKVLEGEIEGGLIVQRKSKSTTCKPLKKCLKCLGLYQRHGFSRHRCVDKTPTGELVGLKTDNSDHHFNKIVNGIRNIDHRSIAGSDTLLRIIARRYVSRHGMMRHAEYQHLRFNLNLLANLILRFREVTGRQATTATDMISPQNFDEIVLATKDIAGFASNGHIRAPSCVGAAGRLLVECAEALQGAEIKAGRAGQEAAQFLHLMSSSWAVDVGDAAALQLKEAKITKTAEIPLTSDIRIFCDSLREKIDSLTKKIKKEASAEVWRKLAEVVLAYIIIFNRRRPTEAATMTLSEFSQVQRGMDSHTKELRLTQGEQHVLTTLARVTLRGKRSRPVPVILTPDVQVALQSLIDTRQEGMVSASNPFVFALNSKGSDGYIRGSDALRVTVEGLSEKLKHPERLRSTNLRKEIATTAQVLGLNDADFEVLCRWMGHTEAVHLRHYRQNFQGHQVTQMAPLLFAMEEGTVPRQKGTALKDVTYRRQISDSSGNSERNEEGDSRQEEVDDADPVPAVAGKPKERNYSKFSKEEEMAVRKLFQDSILGGKLPGKKQILLGIASSQTLKERSWTQVKDKVANERKKHLKHMH